MGGGLTQSPSAGPGRPGHFARLSIRNKLLAMVLLPLVGVLPLLGAFLLWWGSEALDRMLLTKVRSDLAVANGYFDRVLGEVGASATGVAESAALLQALQGGQTAPLLARLAQRERLDFINWLPPDAAAADRTSVEVFDPAQQGLLSPALRQRVAVPLVARATPPPPRAPWKTAPWCCWPRAPCAAHKGCCWAMCRRACC